jgi:hypothetical protein
MLSASAATSTCEIYGLIIQGTRKSFGIETTLEYIRENRGIHYDPAVVDACLLVFEENLFTLW